MEARERRSALRSAHYRADGPAVVSLAAEVLQRADVLQLLGDGLLAAVDQRVEGAREAASALRRCVSVAGTATSSLPIISRAPSAQDRL